MQESYKAVLSEIQDGTFARDWMLENQVKRPHFIAMRNIGKQSQLEKTGEELRGKMSWHKNK